MLSAVVSEVSRLLKERNVTINFVDIGSRNGVIEMRDIAKFVSAYGFEPNPEEYERLLSGNTEMKMVTGVTSPSYRHLSYSPYAIGDRNGESEFYVTPGPGACGMLEPNLERLREIIWKGRTYKKNFA